MGTFGSPCKARPTRPAGHSPGQSAAPSLHACEDPPFHILRPLQGMFLGEPSEALKLLREAGLLEGLDPEKRVGLGESDTAGEQPIGLVLKAWPSFYDYATFMVRRCDWHWSGRRQWLG